MANKRSVGPDSPGNGPARRFRTASPSGSTADWESASGDLLKKVVVAAAIFDGAVRFGISADGGAYSIGIYGDGPPYTTWVPCTEDIDATLVELAEYFGMVADQRAAEGPGKAKKR